MKDPHIDPKVWENQHLPIMLVTGIYIRAKTPDDKWESIDIAYLDKESLLDWLKSRGGDNPMAEDVVGILLGHGHLHP